MSYRAPPAVLPSLRSLGEEPTETILLIRAVAALVDHHGDAAAVERETSARARAAAAPCPEASTWRFDGPVPPWLPPPHRPRACHPPFNAAGA